MCHSSGGGIVLYRPLTEILLEGVGWNGMGWYGSGKHDDINKVVAKEGNFQEISILLFVCLVLLLLIGFLFSTSTSSSAFFVHVLTVVKYEQNMCCNKDQQCLICFSAVPWLMLWTRRRSYDQTLPTFP